MTTADSVTCPQCNGAKRATAHVNYGGTKPNEWIEVNCILCKGAGTISRTQMQWVEDGKRMRDNRVARQVTLRDEALRLGIGTAELSAIERGIRPAHTRRDEPCAKK